MVLLLLPMCHSVVACYSTWKSAIPRSIAFQRCSADVRMFGFVFKNRTPNSITIGVMGLPSEYEVLHIFYFDHTLTFVSGTLQRLHSATVLFTLPKFRTWRSNVKYFLQLTTPQIAKWSLN